MMIVVDQYLSSIANSILILSLLSLGLLFVYFRNHAARSPKLNLPPGPRKVPIIGNIHQMIIRGSLPHRSLLDMAKKYGPVFSLQLGARPVVVFSTPESVKEVLKSHELAFAQRPLLVDRTLPDLTTRIVFSPYGEYWRQVHKIAALKLLSARKVHSFGSLRIEEVNDFVECINSMCGSPFNLSRRLQEYGNSIICKAALGRDVESEEVTELVIEAAVLTDALFILVDMFPFLKIIRSVCGMNWKADRLSKQREAMLDSIIEDHRRKREGHKKNKTVQDCGEEDLTDVLLGIQESDNNGFQLSDDSIKAIIIDLYFGGVETISTTLEWAVSEMLRHPSTMAKAQAEVREVLQGKRSVDESDLKQLKYLKLVIKETLRLHPPAPIVARESQASCKINGYDIPKHMMSVIHLGALGRDPEYWKDPETFVPERFFESTVDFMGTNFQFLPFGSGRRMCPGIALAMASIELPLATLLYHFDWNLPNGQIPQELDMSEVFGPTVKRKDDLYLIPTRIY